MTTRTAFAKIAPVLAGLALVAAACGDTGGNTTTTGPSGVAPTSSVPATSTAPPTTVASATTVPPATTIPPATTAAPATTVAPTTTAAALDAAAAQAVVDAKTAAVLALAPADWTAELDPNPFEEDQTDIIFSGCAGEDAFDLGQLDASSAAIAEAVLNGPAAGFFPGPQGNVEARVFLTEDIAKEAFDVLAVVFGTPEGRECLAGNITNELGSEAPADTEFTFAVDEFLVDDADFGVRITVGFTVEDLGDVEILIDYLVRRIGACTVFSSWQGFAEPFDPALQQTLFSAAVAAGGG